MLRTAAAITHSDFTFMRPPQQQKVLNSSAKRARAAGSSRAREGEAGGVSRRAALKKIAQVANIRELRVTSPE
jgi:hypothetical protein